MLGNITFMFEVSDEHVPAVGDTLLRLHGPWDQAIMHASPPSDDEPTHVAAVRVAVDDRRDMAAVADRLCATIIAAAGLPHDAVTPYAACQSGW